MDYNLWGLLWIDLGLFLGLIAYKALPGRKVALIDDALIGLFGSYMAGSWFGRLMYGNWTQTNIWSMIAAYCGAVIILISFRRLHARFTV